MSEQRPIEIMYRGHSIRFAENQEVWRCFPLDVEGEKLATVKRKIDKVISEARKLTEAQTAIVFDPSWNTIVPVKVIAFAEPRKKGAEPDSAWCMVTTSERYFDEEKKTTAYRPVERREKKSLAGLKADTPENRATFAEIERLKSEAEQIADRIKVESAKLISFASTYGLTADPFTQENDNAD